MFHATEPDSTHADTILSSLGHVHVTAPEAQAQEPPRVVVRRPHVVAVQPVMQADGEPDEVQDPAYQVGLAGRPKLLA